MRRLLFLLVLLPSVLFARQRFSVITRDSLPNKLSEHWLFSNGDDPAMALPEFNDSNWAAVDPLSVTDTAGKKLFSGSGWFRLHFVADTSACRGYLALKLSHNGASEVYLDGKLLIKYGAIYRRDSLDAQDPQWVPQPFSLTRPGPHVLALRYANSQGISWGFFYKSEKPGFTMYLDDAEGAILSEKYQAVIFAAAFNLLCGLFLALALLHFIFFLYTRSDKSNLLFSLFSFSIALLFFAPFLARTSIMPEVILAVTFSIFFVTIIIFFSLSGFLNLLFAKRRLWFKLVTVLCVAVAATRFIHYGSGMMGILILMTVVGVQSVFLIVRAIVRREPGARIIGAGLLLLIMILLSIFVVVLFTGDFILTGEGIADKLFSILLCIAIISIPISMSAYLARNFAAVSRDLKKQLVQVQDLSRRSLEQETEKQRLLESRQEELEHEVNVRTREVTRQKEILEQQHGALKAEKKKTDDLLLNILPAEVAEELKETGAAAARLYNDVSVLFTDFVDFTQVSEQMSPAALVTELDTCFKAFDAITGKYGLEKIKTIGDAYLAVCGLPVTDEQHALQTVRAAIAMRDFMEDRRKTAPASFHIRLGIHSGPVVAGIVGVKKFAYDIWGDTVNTAARMEQASEGGKVNISAATYVLIKDHFDCEYRGELEAKHKGKMGMYFVNRAVDRSA